MTTESPPVTRQRHFYIGMGTFIRYRDGREELYSSTPDSGYGSRVAFVDMLIFSLIVVFWIAAVVVGVQIAHGTIGGPL